MQRNKDSAYWTMDDDDEDGAVRQGGNMQRVGVTEEAVRKSCLDSDIFLFL